jgi:uncharacterized protein
MVFEFNSSKRQRNREKHGIDFDEAQSMWNDEDRLEIAAKTLDELRFLVVGKIIKNTDHL